MDIVLRLAVVLTFLLVFSAVFLALAWWVTSGGPTPENRPAPAERMADMEEARDAALRKIAARKRTQHQREASARISRGF